LKRLTLYKILHGIHGIAVSLSPLFIPIYDMILRFCYKWEILGNKLRTASPDMARVNMFLLEGS